MTADIGELPDLDFDIEAELNAGEDVPMCGVTEGSNLQPTATATYGSCSSIGSMRANPFPQAHTGSASTQIAGTSSISRTITRFDGGHPMTSTLRPWTNTANSGFGTTTMPKHGAAPERRFVQQVVSSPEHHLYGRVLGADGYSEESPPNISACSLGSVSSCVRSPTGTSPDSSGYASGGSGGGCQRSLPSPENAASKNAGPYLPDSVRQYALQDRSPMGKPMPPSSATHLQGMTPRPGMVHPRRAIIQHPVNIQQPALHRAPQVLGNHSLGSQSQKVSSEVGPVKRLLTPRHPPNVLFAYSLDYRICEINRRLLNMKRSGAAGIAQWIAFTDEYFEPGAFLGISFCLENGLNQFKVPRNLIPQFFMTYLESVAELQFLLNNIKVVSVNSLSHSVLVDCPNGNVTTVLPLEEPGTTPTLPHQGRKINNDFTAMVRMDCRFSIEFGSQSQQFKSFSFAVRNHQELIPRQIARDFGVEACQSSLTRGGLPNNLISFLRMSHILSPMQELMTRQKQTGLPPQETLRHAVFERTQQIAQRQPNGRPSPPTIDMPQVIDRIAESGFQKPVAKQRRRRKQTENPAGVQAKKANRRGSQQLQTYEATMDMNPATSPMSGMLRYNASLPHEGGDARMMMVRSPTIMGVSFKEEERYISKIDNHLPYADDIHSAAFSPRGCSPTTRF